MRQLAAQHSASATHAGHDCSYGDSEDVARLLIGEFFHIHQQQNCPKLDRELIERGQDFAIGEIVGYWLGRYQLTLREVFVSVR
jgi:hypothetical protein